MKSSILNHFFVIFLINSIFISCANIVPLTGGARDTTPPKVVNTIPAASQTNFNGRTIVFRFDEFVTLDNPTKNITISPLLTSSFNSSIVGKNVHITFKEPLDINTTYSLNFNNSIKDYTEGNLLSLYTYKFSTGSILDSSNLIVSANDIITLKSSEVTNIVAVKNKNDFFSSHFRYLSKLSNGTTVIDNLDKKSYYLYAFVDSNLNNKYDKQELVGFVDTLISNKTSIAAIKLFVSQPDSIIFNLIAVNKFQAVLKTTFPIYNVSIFNKNFIVKEISSNEFLIFSKNVDTLSFIDLKYNDNKLKRVVFPKNNDPLVLGILETSSKRFEDVLRYDTARIPLNSVINRIETSKIQLFKDTLKLKNYSINYNNNNIELYNLDTNSSYKLILDTFSVYSNGFTIVKKPIEYKFKTISKDLFTTEAKIIFENYDSKKSYIVEVVNNGIKRYLLNTNNIELKSLVGNQISISVIQDQNNNGFWDTGNVYLSKQPEVRNNFIIMLEKDKKEYKLNLK